MNKMPLKICSISVKSQQLTPEITPCPLKYGSVETYVPLNKVLRENPAYGYFGAYHIEAS